MHSSCSERLTLMTTAKSVFNVLMFSSLVQCTHEISCVCICVCTYVCVILLELSEFLFLADLQVLGLSERSQRSTLRARMVRAQGVLDEAAVLAAQ